MRIPFRVNYFDYVCNFFTSFGYFNTDKEHLITIKNISKAFKPLGKLVLDYFNSKYLIENLMESEEKWVGGILFRISRMITEEGYIVKNIEFRDGKKDFHFLEKVRAFTFEDFQKMFESAGMKIASVFGGY
jgi:SAM-dependent methyltransferase